MVLDESAPARGQLQRGRDRPRVGGARRGDVPVRQPRLPGALCGPRRSGRRGRRAIPGLAERLGIGADDPDARAFETCSPARPSTATTRPAKLVDESASLLADGALTLANLWDLDTLVLGRAGLRRRRVAVCRARSQRRLASRAFSRGIHAVQVDLSSNPATRRPSAARRWCCRARSPRATGRRWPKPCRGIRLAERRWP